MGTVTPLRDVMSKEVREAFTTIEKTLSTEDIEDVMCVMRRRDGTDIHVIGAVSNRWTMIGFLEEMKYWLLKDD